MSKIHNFKEDLAAGKKQEEEFYNLYKDKLEWLQGKGADFRILRTGETIEIKHDNYDPDKTDKFFMERYSHGDSPGGAYQAASKGITYYIYKFHKTGLTYVFRTTTLVQWLQCNVPKPWLISVRNRGYTTQGFLVKRELLEEIALNIEEILA